MEAYRIGMSFTASKTYGEYQHTLAISEMPRHDHAVITGICQTSAPEKYGFYPLRTSDTIDDSRITYTRDKGSSIPHNNIQPSIVVFFWKRTA